MLFKASNTFIPSPILWIKVSKDGTHKFSTTRNNLSPIAFIMIVDIDSDIKGYEVYSYVLDIKIIKSIQNSQNINI